MLEHFNKTRKNRHTFLSRDCQFIYHLGIIDYLQDYHWEKKAENFLKETILGRSSKEAGEISAVHPNRYAPRFSRFMASYVVIDQKEGRPRNHSRGDSLIRADSLIEGMRSASQHVKVEEATE